MQKNSQRSFHKCVIKELVYKAKCALGKVTKCYKKDTMHTLCKTKEIKVLYKEEKEY